MQFWQHQLDHPGLIYEHVMVSSAGAYTAAYPMTLIAYAPGEERWASVAQDILIKTYEYLVQSGRVYLRRFQDGRHSHRN